MVAFKFKKVLKKLGKIFIREKAVVISVLENGNIKYKIEFICNLGKIKKDSNLFLESGRIVVIKNNNNYYFKSTSKPVFLKSGDRVKVRSLTEKAVFIVQ